VSQYSLHDLATRHLAAGESDAEHRDILALLRAIVGESTHPAGIRAFMRDALGHRAEPGGPDRAPSLLPPDADRALLLDFVVESRELLDQADLAVQELAREPDHADTINAVFRALHTLKGTSAFLALDYLTEFAHHAESLLSRVRDRELRCVGETAELVLQSVDMLRALLDTIQGAIDGHADLLPDGYGHLLATLRDAGAPREEVADSAHAAHAAHGIVQSKAARETVAAQPDVLPNYPERGPPRRDGHNDASASTVRVRTDALDRLIELVGELVVAESMVAQHPLVRQDAQGELPRHVASTGKLVRELQHLSIAMRMVPLQPQFQRVDRLVRDLAMRSGKRIEFVAEGEQIEIDRQVAERLGDPLLHMVRNAVDHGIELPADRHAAGKSACGTVHLRAYRADGGVVLELRDDGRGLDRDRLVRKALQLGHITSAEGLSDSDVHALIFRPGFSTADRITDVSGRGVGMDVVQRNIEALRGRVAVFSQAGHGTTLRVQLPLTAALTEGLLVRVGGERFLVPSLARPLAVRPPRAAVSVTPDAGEVVRWHEELLPVVRLHQVFGIATADTDAAEPLLVVVGDAPTRVALLVDDALGQHQVITRPHGHGSGSVPGVAGEAFLADGGMGRVLDIEGLCSFARDGDPGGARADTARAVA